MRRALVLLFVLLATSLTGVRPSQAQFAECTNEYINSFCVPAYGWSPGQVDCHEFWRLSFHTPAGERWIRLIGDRDAAIGLPAGAAETIRESARRSTESMRELGAYLIDDVTLLLGRPRSSPTEPQPEYGYSGAWTGRAETPGEFDACHVTLFVLADFSTVDIHHTVAHELFHCIEQASLSTAQYATAGGAGAWWVEGAAEEFASVVAGTAGGRWERVSGFESAVRERRALNEMSYNAEIFFLWHYQRGGLEALLPFLRQMAGENTSSAQQTAMEDALSQRQWLDFAQAYDDRRINDVGGGSLGFGQRIEGEVWEVQADFAAHQRDLEMFVLETGWAEYACGAWENEISDPSIEVRREDSTTWGRWPARLDTENRGDVRLRIISLVSRPEDVEFRLEAEKRESCTGCLVSRVIDRCIVGRWRQTGGGPLEYLRRNHVPITTANQTTLVLTMRDDGTFSTNSIETGAEMETTDSHGHVMRGTANADTRAVTGRWSAEDGALMGCIDSGGERNGVTVLEAEGRRRTMPVSGGSMGGLGGQSSYTCSDTTFTTSAPTAHGPMEYEFTRETPPPRRG
jgi:hypothetical protein